MERILTPDAIRFIKEWNNCNDYVVAHTSGSTGTPKEIHLLKRDMRASARATVNFFGLTPNSTLYLPLSPDYIAGKMQIVRAFEAECSLIVTKPSNLTPIDDNIKHPIDLLPIVPSQIPGLLKSNSLPKVKNVIIGGAPINTEYENELKTVCNNAYATYGMTETCSHVALRKLGEEEFKALPGFEFSTDERGCLVITSSILSFGTLTTNDIIELNDCHNFRWLGRYDNVINSGGIKIYPEEIERLIAPMFPHGTLFYVTSRSSAKWGEEAIIVTNATNLPSDFFKRLKALLPPYRTPKAIIRIPDIPLTSSKKIIRKKFI